MPLLPLLWLTGCAIDRPSPAPRTGATDNVPDDAPGCTAYGAGASFTCAGAVCR